MIQMPVKYVTDEVFDRAKTITFNSIEIGIEIFVLNKPAKDVYREFGSREAPYSPYVIDRIQLMVDQLKQEGLDDMKGEGLAKLILEKATSIFEGKYVKS